MPVTKQCLYCNTDFTRLPYIAKQQRFCSKQCWFAWHKKENNSQYNRIEITCEVCGAKRLKTPTEYNQANHHYCSTECSRIASRETRKGSNNKNWKGGSIESRGPHWSITREDVMKLYGYKCGECGMTNEDHNNLYHKNLHVHHITPYRLTKDNGLYNLIPLCIPCHRKIEDVTNQSITPLEKLVMIKNTETARENGTDKIRYRTVPCPTCGGRKNPRSKTCRKCWWVSYRAQRLERLERPKNYCVDCGIEIGIKSTRCRPCRYKSIAAPLPEVCSICGKQLVVPRKTKCHRCATIASNMARKGIKHKKQFSSEDASGL